MLIGHSFLDTIECSIYIFDTSSCREISYWDGLESPYYRTDPWSMEVALGHDGGEDLLLRDMRDEKHRIDESRMIREDDDRTRSIQYFKSFYIKTIPETEDVANEKEEKRKHKSYTVSENVVLLFMDIIVWVWIAISPSKCCGHTRISPKYHRCKHEIFSDIMSSLCDTGIEICICKKLLIEWSSLPVGSIMRLTTVFIVSIDKESTSITCILIGDLDISISPCKRHTDKESGEVNEERYSKSDKGVF